MVRVLDLAKKVNRTIVEFEHGDSAARVFERYTDDSEDFTFLGEVYSSTPSMEIAIPTLTGALEEDRYRIVLPDDAFTIALSNGQPHAPVIVTVREILDDPDGVEPQETLTFLRGDVDAAIRNYQGRSDRVALECTGVKNRISIPTGLQANSQCPWTFQARGCIIPDGVGGFLSAVTPTVPPRESATVVSVVSRLVTIDVIGVFTDKFFHRGFLEVEGLRITVRDWNDASPLVFQMVKEPPQSWIGKIVSIQPGCDKHINVCRIRWANETAFGGFGFAIPSHHPNFEAP